MYLIVEHFQKKHINFHAMEPPSRHTEVEHKIEMVKKNNVESAPPDIKRIVTTAVSPITLPDVPEVPQDDEVTPTAMSGVNGVMGSGIGSGLGGSGNGSGNGGGYGAAETEPGFVGVLYDLKQTPDQQPTDIAENKAELESGSYAINGWPGLPATQNGLRVLRSFVKKWDMSLLDKYYKAPATLITTQICIPVTPSENAPKAFHVEGTVHPRRWNVIYQATIIPPETGQFRFIGFADDFLMVRMDGRNVLDGSLSGEELDSEANVHEDVGTGPEGQPLKCGKWIQMDAGTPMDMMVLIGEGPGGFSGFLLMIQKQGVNTPKGDYPVFQLQEAPIPDLGFGFQFSKKKMLFQVSPSPSFSP
jgi:hypothetical protein